MRHDNRKKVNLFILCIVISSFSCFFSFSLDIVVIVIIVIVVVFTRGLATVRRFVRPSIGPLVFEAFLRWGRGVDGSWMPLPTRPQRYCDPASLVLNVERFLHYCSCPTVCDCLAVYPALFQRELKSRTNLFCFLSLGCRPSQ